MNIANNVPYQFDFSGEHPCLDFVNTLGDRWSEQPNEHLNRYSDLLSWSVQAHLLDDEQAARLEEVARQRPHEAESVLARAIELRERLYRIFLAVAQEHEPDGEDLRQLSRVYAMVMEKGLLRFHEQHVDWQWTVTAEELDAMLWFVVRSAVELLTSKNLTDVRVCAADDCGWLFLDVSKNHSRRWCDMKTCGNRAKARKFYQQRERKKPETA